MKKNLKRALSLAFALALVLAMTTAALAADATYTQHYDPKQPGVPCTNIGINYIHLSTPANSGWSTTHKLTTGQACTITYYAYSHTAECAVCHWKYPGTYDRSCFEGHSVCGNYPLRCNG